MTVREQSTAKGWAEAAGVYHPFRMARQAWRGAGRGVRAALSLAIAAVAGCGDDAAPTPTSGPSPAAAIPLPRRYPLLVIDQDAGAPLPDGGRAGAIFLTAPVGGGSKLTDPRWIDPCDALQLPDGSWLILESRWAPGADEARGAIFRVTQLDGKAPIELWWTDSRTRQPVAIVRDAAGTIFVSDRDADPTGVRAAEPGRQRTGCVFGIEVGADGRPSRTAVVAAGSQFFTPGALLACGPLLLLMDADANPRGVLAPDGRPATPGVLFELDREEASDPLAPRTPRVLVESTITTSPVGLIARRPTDRFPAEAPTWWSGLLDSDELPAWLPEVYLVDANYGTQPAVLGDGAIFRVEFRPGDVREVDGRRVRPLAAELTLQLDPTKVGPHTLVDPAYGCRLSDGVMAIADANADPNHLGPDGTTKGVYGTARGAIIAWDPRQPDQLTVLLAIPEFVTPVAVRSISDRPPR